MEIIWLNSDITNNWTSLQSSACGNNLFFFIICLGCGVWWSPKSMWESLTIPPICTFVTKQQCTSANEHQTHIEAWWRQHQALRMCFYCWNWGFGQSGEKYEQFQAPVSIGTKSSQPLRCLLEAVHRRCPHNLTNLEFFCEEQ